MIMRYSHGPISLHAIVSALPRAKSIYRDRTRAECMMRDVMNNGGMSSEIQMLLCVIISVRRKSLHSYKDTKPLRHLLNDLLSNPGRVPNFDRDLFAKPLQLLEDCADICSHIAQAETSFVKCQLSKVMKISKAKRSEQRGHKKVSKLRYQRLSPSPVERYRISRALWRLWLYFEIFNTLRNPFNYYFDQGDYSRQWLFFQRLVEWEVEEMECVYHHLKHQTQLWRKTCPDCNSLYLPDDLLEHQRSCNKAATDPRKSQFSSNFSGTCQYFRNHFQWTCSARPIIWTDSPSEADLPNAGFLYLTQHWNVLSIEADLFGERSDPVYCYLNWGYCIWDERRLKLRKLLEESRDNTLAVQRRWKKKPRCDDCKCQGSSP